MTGGSLYIERMTAATATTLTLSGSVFYQRIDGTISGGTQTDWIQTSSTSFVPRDLSQLQSVSPDSSTLLYADAGLNGNGSITAQDLASMVAPLAAASFRVNMVDVLANKPLSADPGYVFYASDTGDLYIMGDDGETWGPAVHIQGGYGYTFTPAVDSAGNLTWTASIVPVTSGGPTPPTSVNIMGPQGSQGADGASAFDVWREATGSSSAQVSDYL